FFEDYPNIKLNIRSGWSAEVLQMLEKNEIQIAFITGDYNWSGARFLVTQDPLTIISRDTLNISDLPKLPRINYKPKKVYKASLELTDSITKLVNNWWYDRYQEDPNIIMEVDKVEACKEIVKRGIGYSIVPYSCLTEKDAFHTFDLTTL